MDTESSLTYFELQAKPAECMREIALAASKTYARGLIFITVYFDGTFYVAVQDGQGCPV